MRRVVFVITLLFVTAAEADVEVTLRNDWMRRYANTATITGTFTFDKAPKRIHAQKDDGEIHIAGRSPAVQLPIVAEVMNARGIPGVLKFVQDLAAENAQRSVTGAWRLWSEHAGLEPQVQGQSVPRLTTTNPEHVFEIHPLTKIGEEDYTHTFTPIEGYKEKDAEDAFVRYENLRCHITPKGDRTTIRTTMAGYNFVKFQLRLREAARDTANSDGYILMARVEDLMGDPLVHKRRMFFVKDTPPGDRIKNLRKNDCVVVLGMPRINLALVLWRLANRQERPEVLEWNLPYEMLIIGVYNEKCAEPED